MYCFTRKWHIFHILTSEDMDEIIYRFLHWIYIIKRKLHRGLKIWILSSRGENNILRSFAHFTVIRSFYSMLNIFTTQR